MEKPLRKVYRLLGLLVPLLYYSYGRTLVLWLTAVVGIVMLLVDIRRLTNAKFNWWMFKHVHWLLKKKERYRISGMTAFLAGSFLAVLLFRTEVAIAAVTFSVFGDAFAEFIGSSYGRIKTFGSKTLEGSIACFVSCWITGFVLSHFIALSFLQFFTGAFIAAVTEAVSTKVDDNFTMTVLSAAAMQVL